MELLKRINQDLKEAMLSKDQKVVEVLRMVKTRITERAKSFGNQEMTDDVVKEVITAYRKSLAKAIIEFGDKAEKQVEELKWEMSICDKYLPQMIVGEELQVLVKYMIGSMSILETSQIGRLMGALMKTHKGRVDGMEARKIAEELLGKTSK